MGGFLDASGQFWVLSCGANKRARNQQSDGACAHRRASAQLSRPEIKTGGLEHDWVSTSGGQSWTMNQFMQRSKVKFNLEARNPIPILGGWHDCLFPHRVSGLLSFAETC